MQWYYAVNGKQNGPVDEAALRVLAQEGKLGRDDLVWNTSMGNQWSKAGTVPGLFGDVPVSPGGVAASAVPGAPATPASSAGYESRTPNRDLMAQARQCLAGKWGLAVGVVLVNGLIGVVAGFVPFIGWMISLAITGPLMLGMATVFLAIARSESTEFSQLFDGFKRFGTAFMAYLLMGVFTLLWFLLLIVPGIIAALSYSMTFFILRDNPDMGAMEAIDLSKQVMQGNKWKYFCLQWRFFGWSLLCLFTLGIGYLWLWPYVLASQAKFYEDLQAG